MKLLLCTQAVDQNHPILGFFHGWILEFAKHFSEVHVICLEKGEYTLPPHVFVYSLGKEEGENKFKYIFRFYKHFAHIFFHIRVDFVFFHMGAIYNILASPFFCLRKLYKTKFYWWKAHGHINALGKLSLLFVDRVYTSTESGFPVRTKKKYVVGQAIDASLFSYPDSNTLRRSGIMYVGRIMPIKRLEDFIATAHLLLKDNPESLFSIVGPVGDEVYYKKLLAQCTTLGIANKVQFLGPRRHEELVALYQTASIFLNTSQTQSMDKTVVEAAFCGCIPVTSNIAFMDLLKPEGLCIERGDAQAYATIITRVLQQTDTENEKMRVALKDAVIEKHSLVTFTHRIFQHD